MEQQVFHSNIQSESIRCGPINYLLSSSMCFIINSVDNFGFGFVIRFAKTNNSNDQTVT